jgi:hypothetical protein
MSSIVHLPHLSDNRPLIRRTKGRSWCHLLSQSQRTMLGQPQVALTGEPGPLTINESLRGRRIQAVSACFSLSQRSGYLQIAPPPHTNRWLSGGSTLKIYLRVRLVSYYSVQISRSIINAGMLKSRSFVQVISNLGAGIRLTAGSTSLKSLIPAH